MSGIEVAGLVLGSFPIILNCLDYYREGFEPLEEWWNFRTHFVAFIDDIRHQMMKYNENMIRLLDPIVANSDSLTTLVRDAEDLVGSMAVLLVFWNSALPANTGDSLGLYGGWRRKLES